MRRPRVDRTLLAVAAGALFLAVPSVSPAHGPTRRAIDEISVRIAAGGASFGDFLSRGELYRIERDWSSAERDFDRAAQLEPRSPAIALARGALHLDQGQHARAKTAMDRLLSDHPNHPEALRIRAQASIGLGLPLEAARDLDRRIVVDPRPSPDHYVERARLLAGCGDRFLNRAVRGQDEGIARFGPIVSLQFCAIELETKQGNFDSALARLDAIAPQFDRKEVVLERRGEILAAAGRDTEARDAFQAALAAIESAPSERRGSESTRELESRLRASLGAKR